MFRAFRTLFAHELISMLRAPESIFFIFLFPLFFLGIMLFSFGSEGTLGPVTVEVVDQDNSGLSVDYSHRIEELFKSSGVITGDVVATSGTGPLAAGRLRVTLPAGFETAVLGGHDTEVRLEYNASNSMVTQIATRVFEPLNMRFNIDSAQYSMPARIEYKNATGLSPMSFPQYLVTGILVMSMLSIAVVSTVVVVAFRREQNTFKLMSCLPLGANSVLLAIVSTRMLAMMLASMLLLTVAVKVFGMPIAIDVQRLVNASGLIAVGGVALLSLGLLAAARIATVQGAIFVGNVIYISLLFLSDLAIPLRSLSSGSLQFLGYLPTTAFVSGLRSILVHGESFAQQWHQIAIMMIWAAVFLVTARVFFRWHRQ